MTLFLPILVAVIVTVVYLVMKRRQVWELVLLNIIVLGIGGWWWFYYGTSDGLSQVLGLYIYGASFLILSLIGFVTVLRRPQK
ncbi:hypothetical protein OS242_13740 [Tumebacillus sp. DT12]|uniref:Uncharacterized protein n=1 Tax=Tumebacillus lacus TaxID=2995335 RepID=A0ABT3X264_9BACL|nr:hypothetical protein [Tumebacillus lacus]MCX7571007.1 hypothetical protein [Tumebacillus lacus]